MRLTLEAPGMVHGTVTRGGAPLPRQTVYTDYIKGDTVTCSKSVETDDAGAYTFSRLSPGWVDLHVIAGQLEFDKQRTRVQCGKVLQVDFAHY